jgi:hypothetical protein
MQKEKDAKNSIFHTIVMQRSFIIRAAIPVIFFA